MSKQVAWKVTVVAVTVIAIGGVIALRALREAGPRTTEEGSIPVPGKPSASGLPRLVDLGAGKCTPCKMMAPILEELKKEYVGRMEVFVIDTSQHPSAAEQYAIQVIPTQVFYDAAGKELMRHEGFISKEDILAVWRDLGVDLGGEAGASLPEIVRQEPLAKDTRPKDQVCFMCERDIGAKTKVTVRSTSGGLTSLCSPHCYFIFESCLLDKGSMAGAGVTDYATGKAVPLEAAVYLYGADENGRPTIRAFTGRGDAQAEMRTSGGSILALDALREREYSVRCGFCDRAMYLQDNGSTVQVVGGPKTHGCCPHCALGVAARLRKDIIVEYRDPVDGTLIRVETFDGRVKSLDPPTAVAWFGQKKKPDGTLGSAGCFHQWNFTDVDGLQKWIGDHPRETGRLMAIHQALAAKMKMSPEKIKKACKIGECK